MSTQITDEDIRRVVGEAFMALRVTGRTLRQAREQVLQFVDDMIEREQQILVTQEGADRLKRRTPRETRHEARAWLDTNPNPDCFASNYWEKNLIRSFVEELYALGSALVEVGNIFDEPWRLEQESGPYADELYVTLGAGLQSEQEAYISQVLRRHDPDEFDESRDGQGRIVVRAWWD